MAHKDYVAVIVYYGGDFVIGEDEWEYEGGNEGTIFVDIKKASYIGFVRDIVTFLPCRVQKLLYCVPGKGLRDGLRVLEDDNGFRDVLYHYLHGEEAKVFVENNSDSEDEDDDRDNTQVGEGGGGDGIQASTEVRDEVGHDGHDGEERGADVVHQSDCDMGDVTITELDWEVAESSDGDDDDDDEGLAAEAENLLILSDDDNDEELTQSRKKQRDFLSDRFATLHVTVHPNRDEGPADVGVAGQVLETDYEESIDTSTSHGGVEEDQRAVRRRKSKFPSYDPSVASPTLSVGMKFHDAIQFREAILKNSIAAQRNIDFIRNTKKFVRARCSQQNCPWKIYGAFVKKSGSFQIRAYQEEHTCSINFQNKRVTSGWLSKHFFDLIKVMPNLKLAKFRILVKERVGINVSRN